MLRDQPKVSGVQAGVISSLLRVTKGRKTRIKPLRTLSSSWTTPDLPYIKSQVNKQVSYIIISCLQVLKKKKKRYCFVLTSTGSRL